MAIKLLTESTATSLVREGAGFRAVLITPGKGSSGTYSEEMLKRDAAAAFPPGTLAFVDHPTEQNPGRSARNIIGTYPDGGSYEEGVGIVSNLVPLPHWADWVEAVAPHTGLSIYAMGESDTLGNVTSLVPDTQNSVDIVAYPGRPGSGLTAIYESAVAASDPRTTTLVGEQKKETTMTPEQEAKLDRLATLFESFVSESKIAAEKLAKDAVDVEVVKTEAATERKATIAALEAVNKADLPISLRANLISTVESGNSDVAPLLESAMKLHADVKAEVAKASAFIPRGHVVSESAGDHDAAFNELFGKASD